MTALTNGAGSVLHNAFPAALPATHRAGQHGRLLIPHTHCEPMAGIHITDIEAAINYWREKKPSPDGVTLAPELRALAEVYALLVFYHEDEADEVSFPPKALAAWRTWYHTTADTPCIAICSTSQGDEMCKGCGRTFEEVQHWPEMTPGEKRGTWRRITQEASAWRFGRYADRALENRDAPQAGETAAPTAKSS